VPDTKTNYFWYIFEPLTGELWYYFSSVGEVYAAQQANCGAIYPALGRVQKRNPPLEFG